MIKHKLSDGGAGVGGVAGERGEINIHEKFVILNADKVEPPFTTTTSNDFNPNSVLATHLARRTLNYMVLLLLLHREGKEELRVVREIKLLWHGDI